MVYYFIELFTVRNFMIISIIVFYLFIEVFLYANGAVNQFISASRKLCDLIQRLRVLLEVLRNKLNPFLKLWDL